MIGIEKIIEKISADTQLEAEELRKNAEAERAEIMVGWEKTAAAEYNKLTERNVQEAAAYTQRKNSAADMEAKKKLLALKQELISKAFETAAQQLLGLEDKERLDFLCALAARASNSGSEEIVLTANDYALFGDAVADGANRILSEQGRPHSLKVSSETREIGGGLVLTRERIEVNCSVDTLISLSRDELSSSVAQALFG